ncbi:penicillin-binding protein PBP2A [Streptococcaceae bacterium ESL0729]|nr:penicillin-binding protein PBP2A [Streptococcaceae bacterium ESL0729]
MSKEKVSSSPETSNEDLELKKSKHPYWHKFRMWWKRHNLTKIFLLIILSFILMIGGYLFYLAKTANVSDLQESLRSTTVIIDKNGDSAGSMYGQKGTYVDIDQISPHVIDAVVATEDRSFYSNRGVNIPRTLLAVATLGKFGGGSTITQQLAKNAYLTQKQTVDRKAKEIFLAMEITKKYSKSDIMAMYLNNSYFGNGIWGIEDASHKYFGKSAAELTLDESATLAGILKWPEVYNPLYKDGKFATDRRNTVLQNMVNAKLASQDEANQAANIDMNSKIDDDYTGKDSDYKYPSYFDAVIQEAASKYGLSENDILNNGYKIYTGLDQNYQIGLQDTYAATYLFPRASDGVVAQSASVALDPSTGAVAALVGRVPTDKDNTFRGFNFATQAQRSPGSTIKPLVVYSPAIEAGWTINQVLEDKPHDYNGYNPQNYTRTYQGQVPMYEALAQSLNLPAVYTVNKLGVKTAVAKGKAFGLNLTDKNEELQVALGGGVVTNPWQMAQAYGTFANNGIMNEAHLITKIENSSGQVIKSYKQNQKRVLDKSTNDKMTSMMLGTYSNGTGVYAEPYGYTLAGKTGTTETADGNNTNDQWVIGYTPDVVISLWLGFEKTDETHYLEGASSGQASKIFKQAASYILPNTKGTKFSVENAYALNGKSPVDTGEDDKDSIIIGSDSNLLDDAQEKAKDFSNRVKEQVEKSGIGEKIKDFWNNLKSKF